MKTFAVTSVCLLCFFLLVDGTAVFVGCTNSSLCPSQPVSYMCSGENGPGFDDDLLRWRIRDSSNTPNGSTSYTEGVDVSTPRTIGTYFETILTSSAGPMVSNISPVLAISNFTVVCDILGTTEVSCPIMIAAIPAAPVPNDPNFASDTLTFSWSPSTSTCLSHYNVNVTSIGYTINTTNTSLSLPVTSTNDTEYSISVVAVDTGGRYMDPVNERTYVADVPEFVTDLTINQTGLTINVSWDEPPSLPFLPVLNYIIYPNVTRPDISTEIPFSTTTHIISSVVAGSVYTIGVAAVNVLGTGGTTTAMISIISTSVPSPLTSTSMSMTMSPSVTNSPPVTSMSEVIPSTSTPAQSPTTTGSNSTVYIGIGAGVAVIVIIILIILIIVGCLVWRKPWKGERENTTTNTVIYDTPTDTVHVPNVPVSMNTAYGTATGSRGVVHTSDNVAYGHVSTTSNTEARQPDTVVYEAVQ